MMKELLKNGHNGWLCGFDAPSISSAFESVLDDETRRAAMGANAWKDVQQFDYERTIREYAAGVHRLAGESMPAAPRPAFKVSAS